MPLGVVYVDWSLRLKEAMPVVPAVTAENVEEVAAAPFLDELDMLDDEATAPFVLLEEGFSRGA
jgi:hypothetical protein